MNRIILSFLSLLLIFFSLDANAQRTCASHEHLMQQLSQHPEMLQARNKIEAFTKQYAKSQKNALQKTTTVIYNIPVVVHVLYNTTTQNISDAQIQSQIAVLNADYQKLNTDISLVPSVFSSLTTDCQIQFCLAQRDPNGAATTGIIRKSTTMTSYSADNDNAKYTSTGGDNAWPATSYLNLWVVPQITSGGQPGILGYAQFPGGTAATDGVVIGYNYFGNTGTVSSPYNKGRTATHEVGHWLNLYHIWGDDGGACTGTDNVGDTPNQGSENYGCPTFPHVTCSNGPNGDMFMNYMDYTDDACMYMFSAGQKTRMHSVLTTGGARASLASSLGCVPPSTTSCTVPTGLTTTSVATTTATLNWAAVTGATGYNFQWKTNASTTWTTVSNLSGTTYSLSGLTAGTTYNFQVQTICSSSSSSAYSTPLNFTTTATSTCNLPSGLAAGSVTTTSAALSWAAVIGATGYNLQWKTNTATTWTTVSNLIGTTYNLTGLTAGTTYNFQLQTICSSSSSSAYTTPVNFTTTATITCNIPSGLAAGSVTTTSAALSWATVAGATGYNLQWKTNAATTWTTVNNLTGTTYSLTGLSASTTYNFKVQTICSATSTSAYATAVNFTTLTASVCNAPSGLIAGSITYNSATLSWAAVTGATGYNLQWKTNAATTWTTVSNLTGTTYSLAGLTAATTYNFKVQTICNATSTSAYATAVNFTTTTQSCSAPSGLAASNITTTGATLTWTSVTGVTGYNLQWKTNSATTWTTISNLTTPTYALSSLTASTTYNFKVQSICSSTLTSAYATAVNFTTTTPSPCSAPTGLIASGITSNTVTLGWTAINGAVSYKLQYKKSTATAWTTVSGVTATTYSLTGLTAGTIYNYQVATVCNSASLSASTASTFTTGALCADVYESNNTIATAFVIAANTTIMAKIGTASDKDYYKFSNTTSAPNIKVLLTNLPFDYDLKLYQPNGTTLIATSANTGTTSESVIYNTTTIGTYYACVYGFNSAYSNSSCYNLTAQISASNFRTAQPVINEKTNEEGVSIFYPNPAQTEVSFDYFSIENQDVNIDIYDQSGRLALHSSIHLNEGVNQPKIDVTNLPTGFYVTRLITSQGSISSKLMIQK